MHPPNLVIEQGKSALLRCNVTGEYSKLTWSKGDGLLSWKHEAKKDQLNISHATVEDQGTYFCIAKYKDVVARAAANVIVQSMNLLTNCSIKSQNNEGNICLDQTICSRF